MGIFDHICADPNPLFCECPLKVLDKNKMPRTIDSMDGDFYIENYRDLLVIEVMVEKVDFFVISENSTHLRNILDEQHYPSMIFDFTRVTVIDSSVFGFLLEIRNTIKKNGNEIAIVCRDPEVLHIMGMLKVPQIMRVVESREKAADYLNSLMDV